MVTLYIIMLLLISLRSVLNRNSLVSHSKLLFYYIVPTNIRMYHKTYPLAFTGSEACLHMCNDPKFECFSENEAVALCQALLSHQYVVILRVIVCYKSLHHISCYLVMS